MKGQSDYRKIPKYSDTTIAVIILNFHYVKTWFYHGEMCPNGKQCRMANSVDPDQTAPLIRLHQDLEEQYDLVLH